MAMAHDRPEETGWLTRVLTTDFCPWANRFVYWLKEPIGWFVLATAISVMVGLYLAPIGWTIAAALVAIMTVGMLWPLIAVFGTRCELGATVDQVHEDQPCRMRLVVRNRIPFPLWGLAVEGFLDQSDPNDDGQSVKPTVALAWVPPICTSDYSITVRPPLRGHYPVESPSVTCSFPFGIWTARRKLPYAKQLTVWPKVFPVAGVCPIVGRTPSEIGDGQRGGRSGDFIGVREFRRGDSSKHVNWVASARTDSLIVTERGGPQCVKLDVMVDTRGCGSRQLLADRIRVAASVLLNLHDSRVPMRVTVGSKRLRCAHGAKGRRELLNALADVPADGEPGDMMTLNGSRSAAIQITCDTHGSCVVHVSDPGGGRRAGGKSIRKTIPSGPSLIDDVRDFWKEVRDADVAA